MWALEWGDGLPRHIWGRPPLGSTMSTKNSRGGSLGAKESTMTTTVRDQWGQMGRRWAWECAGLTGTRKVLL